MSFTIKRNDTEPWVLTLLEDGVEKDLTDFGSGKCYMFDSDGVEVMDRAVAVEGAAANGQVKVSPAAGEVDTAGVYDLEIEITWSDATITTFPNDSYEELTIIADLK